ncbi:hypothetical protein Z046_31145 [Pseudomonas aeruginosa VRFPA09]|nr:hypothetical protein Z046_31145 [Pseudomonas aeruginosa VRFPA09]
MSKRQPIATGSEWTFELIQQYDREISRIAERYALDTYPNQIEVITAEQMMDAYASVGMPIGYNHWSYGKHFLSTEKNYKRGQMGLAYEIVINSDPCIAYLMEENTQCMQALVIAHACYGHNSFFKGNYLFRTWTDASSIIDYLVFAKQYIMQCEERYGIDAVEDLLDSCHALMNYGVDRYKRPYPISAEEERQRQKEREELIQRQLVVALRIDEKHCNHGGTAHGGLLSTLADVGLGYAMAFSREPPQPMVTVGLRLDFCGVARVGDWLEVHTRVDKLGQRMAFASARGSAARE